MDKKLIKFKSKRFYVIAVALSAVVICFSFAACDTPGIGKQSAEALFSSWEQTEIKQTETEIDAEIMFFALNSSYKIGQKATLSRELDDGKVFIEGRLETSSASQNLIDLINTVLGMFGSGSSSDMLKEVFSYLKSENHIGFRAGYGNSTVNASAGLLKNGAGQAESGLNAFFGISEEDLVRFLSDEDNPVKENPILKDMDIKGLLMTPMIVPLNYGGLADTAGSKYNRGTDAYIYSFAMESDAIKAYLLDVIYRVIEETFPDKGSDYTALKNVVDTYKDTVMSWLTFSPLKVDLHSDKEGRLTGSSTSVSLAVKIPDADIIKLAGDMGISDLQYINMVLGILGAENNESGITELRLGLNINESYAYESDSFDKNHIIFTPADEELEGRHIITYRDTQGRPRG